MYIKRILGYNTRKGGGEILEEKQESTFVTEKIKDRPLNKRKLIRKTLITAAMAIVFGLIACFTFLVLEPVFSNWLYPQEEIDTVEIPTDTEEVLPEDMLAHEETVQEQAQEVIDSIKDEMVLDAGDYQTMVESIYSVVEELQKTMVTVTGVNQDVDWFNDPYESKGLSTGFLFAESNKELLILVPQSDLVQREELQVTFADGSQVGGEIKGTDANSGLAVIAVSKSDVSKSTLESISVVVLGSSRVKNLMASPVIALGRPLGSQVSVSYGMITSVDTTINLTDANYKLLTTDIYGSTEASGLLFDLTGHVVGVIDQSYNSKTAPNLISAIGITELKSALQRMSNGIDNGYFGIQGTDVPAEVTETLQVPQGAYVTDIVMDSPAMAAGIQRGDVIVRVGDMEITSFSEFTKAVSECTISEPVAVELMRQGQQEYRSMTVNVTVEVIQ
jgi:serine protease Do